MERESPKSAGYRLFLPRLFSQRGMPSPQVQAMLLKPHAPHGTVELSNDDEDPGVPSAIPSIKKP